MIILKFYYQNQIFCKNKTKLKLLIKDEVSEEEDSEEGK